MLQRIKVSVFWFLIVALSACKKDSIAPPIDFNYNYYPLSLTKVLIYNVDSTGYNGYTNTSQNFKFQIKDSVAETYLDDNNRPTFRIERYKKIADVWQFQKTIARLLTARIAEETIDNKNYVRLVFPAVIDTYWNMNSKNTLGDLETYISETNDNVTINGLTFNKTLNSYTENINLIRKDIQKNIYAQDVGLISSDITAVDLNISTGAIVNGYVYSMKIVSYK
jgi:hypothetical protein